MLLKLMEAVSPRLALKWVKRLFRKPTRKKIRKKQKAFYKSGITETLKIKKYTIRIFRKGDGAPVYLNHGWGSYGYDLKNIVNILVKKGYQVIVPDLPCHGRSSGTLANQVEMSKIVETLLLHYNAQNPIKHIVTHSWGGTVTLMALDRIRKEGHPEFGIRKMISIGMPSEFNAIMDIFCNILDLSQTIRKRLVVWIVTIAQSDQRTLEEAFPMGLAELLGEASFDYLLIHGNNDTAVPPRNSVQLAEKFPHIQLLLKEGLGHTDILKEESVQQAVIRHFGT